MIAALIESVSSTSAVTRQPGPRFYTAYITVTTSLTAAELIRVAGEENLR